MFGLFLQMSDRIALLEYTRKRFFLGTEQVDGNLTYTKKPLVIVKHKSGLEPSIVMKKDFQTNIDGWEFEEESYPVNADYIVGKLPGKVEGSSVVVKRSVDKFWEVVEEMVTKYISQ